MKRGNILNRVVGVIAFLAVAGSLMAAEQGSSFTVLCYHRFCDPLKPGQKAPSDYHLPIDEFEWQMAYLKKEGIQPISKDQLEAYWKGEGKLPERAVLLAFDDGFESVYTKAYPVLKKHGYPGVLFLYTDFIGWRVGRDKAGKKAPEDRDALSLVQIQEMSDLLVVESHTKSHLNLAKEAGRKGAKDYPKLLDQELKEPLEKIKGWFRKEASWLAYPFGVYTPQVLQSVQEAGYRFAFTVNPGPNDRTVPALRLKRNLILYPFKRTAFQGLFGTQVLHLSGESPGDGALVGEMPEVSGVLLDEVDPDSLVVALDQKPLKTAYDPATKKFHHKPGTAWRKGGHMLSVKATDRTGKKRENTWYFRVEPKKEKD
jgi:peptidoglycan/xylan/chitin deacetylase (PgdA/CDA1 family)